MPAESWRTVRVAVWRHKQRRHSKGLGTHRVLRLSGFVVVVSLASAEFALAEIPYQIFGVDVYFVEPSPCGDPKKETTLSAKVARFSKQPKWGKSSSN